MTGRALGVLAFAAFILYLGYRSILPPTPTANGATGAGDYTFLGDSLTQGNAIPPPAYPEIVGHILAAKVNNLGVTSLTTFEILLAELHAVPPSTRTAVIYAGTNDLIHEFAYRFAPPRWVSRAAYRFIVNSLNGNGVKTYTVLLRDLARMPAYSRDRKRANAITAWTAAWDAWTAQQGAIPIDLRCFPDMNDPANYQPDQLHPNARGTRLLAEHIAEGIVKGGITCATPAAP